MRTTSDFIVLNLGQHQMVGPRAPGAAGADACPPPLLRAAPGRRPGLRRRLPCPHLCPPPCPPPPGACPELCAQRRRPPCPPPCSTPAASAPHPDQASARLCLPVPAHQPTCPPLCATVQGRGGQGHAHHGRQPAARLHPQAHNPVLSLVIKRPSLWCRPAGRRPPRPCPTCPPT